MTDVNVVDAGCGIIDRETSSSRFFADAAHTSTTAAALTVSQRLDYRSASSIYNPGVCEKPPRLFSLMVHSHTRWDGMGPAALSASVTQCVNAFIEVHWITSAVYPISSHPSFCHSAHSMGP